MRVITIKRAQIHENGPWQIPMELRSFTVVPPEKLGDHFGVILHKFCVTFRPFGDWQDCE